MAVFEKSKLFASPKLNTRIRSANVQNSERWFGYFAGPGIIYITYYVVAGIYLNVFYTDVLKVSGLMGGLFLTIMPILSKIIDAVTNVVMGQIVERTRTRQGKARPWLFVAGPLLAAAGILLYMVPNASDTVKILWITLSYNLYFAFAFTIYNMSHGLMVPLSTRNNKQRDGLAMLNNMAMCIIPGMFTAMLLPMLIRRRECMLRIRHSMSFYGLIAFCKQLSEVFFPSLFISDIRMCPRIHHYRFESLFFPLYKILLWHISI